jgi:hypothetical protein
MAVSSGYFDSVNGDRTYNAEQMSNYFDGLVSNGVYEMIGEKFIVTVQSGMTLNVGSGRGIIQCHWVKNDAVQTVTLDASNAQYPRIDVVCLRLDMDARSIILTKKTGTPAATPVMPDITRNDEVYELYLASVLVPAGATTPQTITDLRPSSLCGWVTGIIKQVDTSDLFIQWQEAYTEQFSRFDAYIELKMQQFNEWFEHLTGQLIVDTTIKKYERKTTATGGGNSIQVGIPEYSIESDILLVFVDGKYIASGYDYETYIIIYAGQNLPAIRLLNGAEFEGGEKVTFVVLKAKVGGNVSSTEPLNVIALANSFNYTAIRNMNEVEG